MARRFVEETALPLTYDAGRAREICRQAISDDEVIFLVSQSDGTISGCAIGYIDHDFFVEKNAYLHRFYIEPEFRGLGVSRLLLAEFESEARSRGAGLLFSSATSGMSETIEALYTNLFKHHGYFVLGRVLVKELNNGFSLKSA